ncbi:MAG: hypothetical protein U0Y96_05870 [Candidatus Kapaibacterium sp.]
MKTLLPIMLCVAFVATTTSTHAADKAEFFISLLTNWRAYSMPEMKDTLTAHDFVFSQEDIPYSQGSIVRVDVRVYPAIGDSLSCIAHMLFAKNKTEFLLSNILLEWIGTETNQSKLNRLTKYLQLRSALSTIIGKPKNESDYSKKFVLERESATDIIDKIQEEVYLLSATYAGTNKRPQLVLYVNPDDTVVRLVTTKK